MLLEELKHLAEEAAALASTGVGDKRDCVDV
jgi:hypothetical protein